MSFSLGNFGNVRHSAAMLKLTALLFLFLTSNIAFSQESSERQLEKADPLPSVDECIPESISKLGEVSIFPFHDALVIAVIARTETAQLHTLQGLNHLHGGWDFEARRHFAVAMKSDPRCLMAHWGMLMAMLDDSPEIQLHRIATAERLIALVFDGEGTDLERGFAYALIKYMEEGPRGAENTLRKIAEKFPKDIQSEVLAALFSRGGYNQLGDITPAQEDAENRLSKLVEKLPNHSVPLHALLLIRAEAPDLRAFLPLAYKLCKLVPNYPPYVHLLGHYEWRCGKHSEAAETFERASQLYSQWMKENGVTQEDCPERIRADCYRSAALSSLGDFAPALASAEQITKLQPAPSRPASPGTKIILWDAQTMAARILMHRDAPGDAAKALASLPDPEANEFYREHSLFFWWVDGLRIANEGRRLVEIGSLQEAAETSLALSQHGKSMAEMRAAAMARGEYPEWKRAFLALEILATDLQGRIALASAPEKRGSAYNWFRAAADRQHPSTLLNAPLLLSPEATKLGDYFLTINEPQKALEAYQEALSKFPNDLKTLAKIEKVKSLNTEKSE